MHFTMPLKQLTLAAVLFVVALLPAAIELSHVRQAEAAPGDHLWSKLFGDASSQYGASVAADAAGNVFVTGYFAGAADFGGETLTSAGGLDIFITKFDSTGTHLWSKRFGDASDQYPESLAVDSTGNIFVTGAFYGSVNFGGETLTTPPGNTDIFIAKFGSTGAHLWSKRFGDTSTDSGRGVAVDAMGNVVLTGSFNGSIDFGGGTLGADGGDIFVAKFDSSGAHVWSQRFAGPDEQNGIGVAVDAAGNVFLTGYFLNSVNFGGGTLTNPGAGSNDIFIAKLDSTGAHLWSKRFGDAANQWSQSVAVDGMGSVFVTGYFLGSMDFGGGVLTNVAVAGHDIFIAKLDGSGGHLWSKRFGDVDYQRGWNVAVDGAGNAFLTGDIAGAADFGGGTLTSAGATDIFIAKFDSVGGHLWSKRFGDHNYQIGFDVAVNSTGIAFLTGYLWGSADFGGGTLTSAGAADIFIAKFSGTGAVGGIAELPNVSALPAAASSGDRFSVVYAFGGALLATLAASSGLYLHRRRRT